MNGQGYYMHQIHSLVLLLLLITCSGYADSARIELTRPPINGSVCPGNVLTYVCTACGPGSTLWKGSAFRCSSTQNEIILQHSSYTSPGGTTRYCNDRAIVGRSLRVENNDYYISQLNVTISTDMNNRTIECAQTTTDAGLVSIGVHTLNVLVVPYSPPEGVKLAKAQLLMEGEQIEFTFNWMNSTDENPFYYLINSSHCGRCPTNTTVATVTCKSLMLTNDPPLCAFSVQSVACGVPGAASDQIEIVPKVPESPTVISIIPRYNGSQALIADINITINRTASSSAIIGHLNISFITESTATNTKVENASLCGNDTCDYILDLRPLCSNSVNNVLRTSVLATNLLGQGPVTPLISIGCTNQFLMVKYDPVTNLVSCSFLNQLQSVTATNKSCSIMYGRCDQELTEIIDFNFPTTSNTAHMQLDLNSSNYCYRAFATNGTFTAVIEGNIDYENTEQGTSPKYISVGALGGSIAATICGFILIVIVAIVSIKCYKIIKGNSSKVNKPESQRIRKECFEEHEIEEDCELKEFEDKYISGGSKSGQLFYKLTKKEKIHEDTQIISENKNGDLSIVSTTTTLKISPPKSSDNVNRLFVQKTGSGPLAAGSTVLYVVKPDLQLAIKND